MTKDLWRFLGLLRPYKRYAGGIGLVLLISLLLDLVQPLFIFVFVNEVVLKSNLNLLVALAATMICVAAAGQYTYGVSLYHRERLGERVLADLRQALTRRLLAQPPSFFETHSPGRLTALAVNEVDALKVLLHAGIFGTATLLLVAAILGLAFVLDAQIALLLLFPPILLVALVPLDRLLRRRNEVALTWQQRLVSFFKIRLSNASTVQLFGREPEETERGGRTAVELAEARARTELLAQVSKRVFQLAELATLAAILLVGGSRLIRMHDLSLGTICALLDLGVLLFRELTDLYHYVVQGRLATVALRRVWEVYDGAPEPETPVLGVRLRKPRGRIEFQGVGLRYGPRTPWALQNLTFAVEPGEFVAIVGLSGSGKSTLFRLLFRFYDPTEGTIRLDGYDLRTLDRAHLRRHLALATQETVLFDDTIAGNIAYGRAGASPSEIVEAARTAMADEFIERLPAAYGTRIGEGGADLSAGQRHRIALARVVLKDAPILLLDEVTASLDANTEEEVQASLDRVRQGRTTLMIAHRLSTVARADRFVVVADGRLVEEGSHSVLYRHRSGLYHALYDRQFRPASAGGAAAG